MPPNADRKRHEPSPSSREEKASEDAVKSHGGVLIVAMFLLALWVLCGHPIPAGDRHYERVKPLLKELVPNRAVSPDGDDAYVAALFHVIHTGEDEVAIPAIRFAAEGDFGNASPYVVERLRSENPEARSSARHFLCKVSGTDLGDSPERWMAWWRNPTRRILGVIPIGQWTLHFSLPFIVLLLGLGLRAYVRTQGKRLEIGFLLPGFWFMCFVVFVIRYVGGPEECTFGEEIVKYHASHGRVLGLDDARLGGGGVFVAGAGATALLVFLTVGIPSLLTERRHRVKADAEAPTTVTCRECGAEMVRKPGSATKRAVCEKCRPGYYRRRLRGVFGRWLRR